MTSNELTRLLADAERHLAAGRLLQARAGYERVLKQFPRSTEALFQMAVILHDQQDLEGAVGMFERLLRIKPDLAEVHFNLGTLLVGLQRPEQAIPSFEKAVDLQPDFADAHNNLGNACRLLGDFRRAAECFERAIRLRPGDRAALTNLCGTLSRSGRIAEAIAVCRLSVERNPTLPEARLALGLALEQAAEYGEAAEQLKEAIRLRPDAVEWQFHLAACEGQAPPPAAPDNYVASLFDAYAAKFDDHLQGSLKYRTPEFLLQALTPLLPRTPLEILDLGCGTGLCGVLFRDRASRMTGIDLSAEMIREAQKRGCYDELRVQNIVDSLAGSPPVLDLVLAADVFVYVGDLKDVFLLTAAALRPGGLFAFSVESAEDCGGPSETDCGYRLNPSRRYAHALSYLRDLSRSAGLSERVVRNEALRMQHGEDVRGWIVVLQKSDEAG